MIDRTEILKVGAPWLAAVVIIALFAASGALLSACNLGALS